MVAEALVQAFLATLVLYELVPGKELERLLAM